MSALLRGTNLAVAFLLELAVLIAVCYAGFQLSGVLAFVVGLGGTRCVRCPVGGFRRAQGKPSAARRGQRCVPDHVVRLWGSRSGAVRAGRCRCGPGRWSTWSTLRACWRPETRPARRTLRVLVVGAAAPGAAVAAAGGPYPGALGRCRASSSRRRRSARTAERNAQPGVPGGGGGDTNRPSWATSSPPTLSRAAASSSLTRPRNCRMPRPSESGIRERSALAAQPASGGGMATGPGSVPGIRVEMTTVPATMSPSRLARSELVISTMGRMPKVMPGFSIR